MLVPSLALAPLWGLSTYQLATRWQAERTQGDLTASLSGPSFVLFQSLQKERRLTAETQAAPGNATRGQLVAARRTTDKAIADFRPVAAENTSRGQQGLSAALADTTHNLDRISVQRKSVDTGSVDEKAAFDYYNGTVDSLITVFTALGRTSNADVTLLAHTSVDLYGAIDMIGREDALLGRDWQIGHLSVAEYDVFVDAVGAQSYLLHRVALSLTHDERDTYKKLANARSWATQQDLEKQIIVAGPHHSPGELVLGQIHAQWRGSVDANYPLLRSLVDVRAANVDRVSADSVSRLRQNLVIVSAIGLLAVILVIVTSWRLTVMLRRRIHGLREEAVELQQRLPDVVARLERGENVDVDREVRLVEPTSDELGELGRALNAASRSAVSTAVRQAEQHRGFERLLQRIARRTQLLIGLQLRKLDELERTHEDPELLDGLFALDHLTARLRRYEENLVILGGGQPQRRWRKPVQLMDVLRAAQGEVKDYDRISIDVEGDPWVSERAVSPLAHILAELMENAAVFSKPPTPVEVRAVVVSRGIAVEIEDRGLGMEPEQYAAANALMEAPPQLDVMTQADDVRLGLYVVARLSAGLGLRVELRPSAFGGTRVIVLLPEQVVVEQPDTAPTPVTLPPEGPPLPTGPKPHPHDAGISRQAPYKDGQLPVRARGHAMAHITASGLRSSDETHESPPTPANADPLPQRVRQSSLAPELQIPAELEIPDDPAPWTIPDQPGRSGATIGAFQRQSRLSRRANSSDGNTAGGFGNDSGSAGLRGGFDDDAGDSSGSDTGRGFGYGNSDGDAHSDGNSEEPPSPELPGSSRTDDRE
ncbi:nitrate- and nitrite sensing domain-containing protein [Streptomyces sp. NBC_01261]|uniref:sensor histidine kinase n=1 Tax=Streptomyces sp. NBC_01261 TaxID=2903802 RepID=UPI002E307EC2|nr:nitrate- and nitrite sensing domain-containing protein [Streptomyces sp. NBC_01261]